MPDSAWFNRERAQKKERDRRRNFEYCYKKLLHGKISTAIKSAKKKFEEKTLYKVEVRSDFSSIEVLVSHQDRKFEKLLNLHFKLRACHKGIFLMYGARVKAQPNSSSSNSTVLYSKPEWISTTDHDTAMRWIEKAATLSIQSLELSEYEAEIAMKKSNNTATSQGRRIWFCRLCRSLIWLR